MIAKYGGTCAGCYRPIEAGSEVHYQRARRAIRHPICPPISTPELLEGRARYVAEQARRSACRPTESEDPYARHDAANAAIYGERTDPRVIGRARELKGQGA